jgi:hypothetical protein
MPTGEPSPAPRLESLTSPAVLVHAWKKANRYIRRHNWVADVLRLDLAAMQLSELVDRWPSEMRERGFAPDGLRLVLAPKRSTWQVFKRRWSPQNGKSVGIRPLAHATVRDQVFGTAFLICLAGGTASYGNRLFCDYELDGLHFRWGNSDTYRKWFTDYRAFIKRPKAVIDEQFKVDKNWAEI